MNLGTLPLRGLAGIAGVVGAVAAVFAWDAGWLTPGRLTEAKIMQAFQTSGGDHPGFRHNHAKGLCATGRFESSGAAAALSKAAVFRAGTSPVVARFALAGPMPFQTDKPMKVRSLAVRFLPADGQEWRIAMIDIPVFPFQTPEGFYEATAATPYGQPGPDPAWMKAFVQKHPETGAAGKLIGARTITAGFADDTFHGLDAFRLIAADGRTTPVRWSTVPEQPVVASAADAGAGNPNYLFDDLVTRMARPPLRWHLLLTLGHADDQTADPTQPWPADRQQVDAGTIVVTGVSSEDAGACTAVDYDPLVLPDGIGATDDPFPSARSAAYLRSFTLRAGVQKPPSAVTTRDVDALRKQADRS